MRLSGKSLLIMIYTGVNYPVDKICKLQWGPRREIKKEKLKWSGKSIFWYCGKEKTENTGGWVASEELKEFFESLRVHQGHRKDNAFQMSCSSSKEGEWLLIFCLGDRKSIKLITEWRGINEANVVQISMSWTNQTMTKSMKKRHFFSCLHVD